MAEAARDEVIGMVKVLSHDDVVKVCEKFSVVVEETRKTKPKAFINAFNRFVCSTEVEDMDDEGLDLFQKMMVEMKSMCPAKDD